MHFLKLLSKSWGNMNSSTFFLGLQGSSLQQMLLYSNRLDLSIEVLGFEKEMEAEESVQIEGSFQSYIQDNYYNGRGSEAGTNAAADIGLAHSSGSVDVVEVQADLPVCFELVVLGGVQSSLGPSVTDLDILLAHRTQRPQLQQRGDVDPRQSKTVRPQLAQLRPEARLAGLLEMRHNLEIAGDDLLVARDEGLVVDLTSPDPFEGTGEELDDGLQGRGAVLFLEEGAHEIVAEHVCCALPDAEHLSVPHNSGKHCALDESHAPKALQSLSRHLHRLLGSEQLEDGSKNAEDVGLVLVDRSSMLPAEQLADGEVEDEVGAVGYLQMGKHSHLKGHIAQLHLADGPAVGVVSREGDEPAHHCHCSC